MDTKTPSKTKNDRDVSMNFSDREDRDEDEINNGTRNRDIHGYSVRDRETNMNDSLKRGTGRELDRDVESADNFHRDLGSNVNQDLKNSGERDSYRTDDVKDAVHHGHSAMADRDQQQRSHRNSDRDPVRKN